MPRINARGADRRGDAVASASVGAQMDLAGAWGQRFHEDLPERGAGPEIGDYAGLPINDAARLRADSWDAAKWTMPERQCEPHPADYAPRGPASMRISSTVDSDLAGRRRVGDDPHVDAAASRDLHGRPCAPVAERAAQLAGILDRRVGGRHAQGHHHSPQGRVAAPQRRAAQRPGDRHRILHPPRRVSDAGHDRQGSGLSHRGVRADVQLGGRSGISVEPVLLHSDAGNRAPAWRGAEPPARHQSISARVRHAARPAVRGVARRPRHDVSRIRRPAFARHE